MKALNFPIIFLTLFFVAGILAGFFVPFSLERSLWVLVFFTLVFLIVYVVQRKNPGISYLFGGAAFLLIFTIGFFVTKFHSPKNNQNHYSNFMAKEGISSAEKIFVRGKIKEKLNSSRYADKYILQLFSLETRSVEGEILLNVQKDSTENWLKIDDILLINGSFTKIAPPRNPHQFNYSEFMENRGVFGQVFSKPDEILLLRNENSMYGFAEKIRKSIVESLRKNGFSNSQVGMVEALVFGQTNDISKETYENYQAAGVVHILSVSGLHVGFVLLIFDFLLKFMKRWKYGKILKVVLLILLMWGFALLAGFSSAVVRSVTMFSVVAFGLNFGRKTNLLNILFLSLLAILLFEPQFVFELGFQLSYLAVFSIVIFQPHFYSWYKPRTKAGKMVWGTMTVSLAAQLGVFPLILYYFHQFPGMFLFSNLIIIPLVGIILGLIMFVVALAFLGILPNFLASWTGKSIDFLNISVEWFAKREGFLIENIQFSFWEMWGCYMVLFCVALLIWDFGYKKLMACGISVMLLLGIFIVDKKENIKVAKFLVFHKSRNTILAEQTGKQVKFFHSLKENIREEYSVKNFCAAEGIGEILEEPVKNIYKINADFLLVVDSSGVFQLPKLKNSFVLLRDSPKVNLERLIEMLKPKKIIADGSNYKSYVKRWQKTCANKNIAFHYTGEEGVFEF